MSGIHKHKERGERLYPKKNSSRYYILSLLRLVNEEILENIQPNSTMLDFGCGNMPYRRLYETKCKYLGVDFEGNEDADIYFESGKIPMRDNTVDYIISTQVLEHVVSPEEYLSECFRVLKKDGKLLLSTHGHWKYHPDPTDYWRWTKDGLEKLLSDNQFETTHTYGLMGLAASGLQLFQDGFSPNLHYRFKGLFFWIIAYLQVKIDKWNLYSRDASVFFTISQKK
ncbi:class I SAM-dependent methyltransferase [Reichenbachiella ulvae]|uniref:Methyltransferase domain-containing protein n=1 Tax=Reichenbachiella ulvae TaxID=2980104 RepID=A0ABT3D024_9BACT|nr:class I SAM-dependent methyltransferase [Reichenbachiella ulvae]MCV9388813.1 methyltransferase domain-containing protein [Reichenbachiella ulvae]